jgi:ATP-dependent DNA helicase RecG
MSISDPCALLNQLVGKPSELEWLEFKENYWDLEQIGKNCSALSNSAMLLGEPRAFIVYGVNNDTHKMVGTSIRLKRKKGKVAKGKTSSENFENWINRVLVPRINIGIYDFECKGKQFAIIELEPTYQSPVTYDGTPYVRIGENTHRLDRYPEKHRAIWLETGRRTFEDAIAMPNASLDDVFKLLDVGKFFELSDYHPPRTRKNQLGALVEASFLNDTQEGTYDVTNMGALLLARDLSKFSALSGKAPRVIKYIGANKMRSEPEKPFRKGYAVGFEDLLATVQSFLEEEALEKGHRVTRVPYHEDMLRETLANALVHQDLTISGIGPMVEIFSNRVEITNPGRSLIDKDRLLNDKRSRNVKLASAMRDLGLCEETGRGLDKVFRAAEDNHLPAPDPILSEETTQMTLLSHTAFKAMTKGEKLRSLYYHCALKYAERDFMTNASLRERFGLPNKQMQAVTDLITAAKKGNKIIPADPDQGKKGAQYIPYWAG